MTFTILWSCIKDVKHTHQDRMHDKNHKCDNNSPQQCQKPCPPASAPSPSTSSPFCLPSICAHVMMVFMPVLVCKLVRCGVSTERQPCNAASFFFTAQRQVLMLPSTGAFLFNSPFLTTLNTGFNHGTDP